MNKIFLSAIAMVVSSTSVMAENALDELRCLQQNVFFEARNQPLMGKMGVAWVTLNRVDSNRYPDTICEVVWQDKQFSWTHDGKSDKPSDNAVEQEKWTLSGLVAKYAIMYWKDGVEGPIDDSVMFHANYVDPYWKTSYKKVVKISDHVFYKETK